ncbi:uncharacterized protein LOC116738597 [Nasonia vitripennis]|uniref:Uncharacterized protein n=1 Tax=Nasonia vitripennis TaxID=7425 RepID=A0A7M7QYG6_NASVI|nr:uncharacterized protein LOC116738597 [Nasonia vitripennis]
MRFHNLRGFASIKTNLLMLIDDLFFLLTVAGSKSPQNSFSHFDLDLDFSEEVICTASDALVMDHNYSEKLCDSGDLLAEHFDLNNLQFEIGKMDNIVEIPYVTEVPEILLENQEPQISGIQEDLEELNSKNLNSSSGKYPIEVEVEMKLEKGYDGRHLKPIKPRLVHQKPESHSTGLPELFQLYCAKCEKIVERDLFDVRHYCDVCERPYHYLCKSCKKYFMGFLVANRHVRCETDAYNADECSRCDLIKNKTEIVRKIFNYKHTTIRLDNYFKCGKCGTIRGKEIVCVLCSFTTTHLRNMKSHMLMRHEVNMTVDQLQLCMLRVEKGKKPFE